MADPQAMPGPHEQTVENGALRSAPTAPTAPTVIHTPDQRVRVFVSSTLQELADERAAARQAIAVLRLTPVLFELGARPHPPRELYRAYLAQSDVFVGLYWQRYGWVAPGEDVSGLEDEYRLAGDKPKLIYVKGPAPAREPGLAALLDRVRADDGVSYKPFHTADELRDLIEDDLALLLTERFASARGDASPPSAHAGRPHDNLPVQRGAIVDRVEDAAAARALLRREDVGLVTLTGPGGTGKTRLALHVAATLRDSFTDGIIFVSLASLADPALVASTIAAALGVREAGGQPVVAGIVDYLRAKEALLVLDNFEQVIAAAPLVTQLLTTCPRLKVLATSRTPLHLSGEKDLPIPPLDAPDPARVPDTARLSQYAAVALFIERAREVKPDFAVTNETAPAVAEICYRLDGLPLAIELAATRVKLLPPQALLARLGQRLPLLTGGGRDAPTRQRTLRDAIAWSYDLLDDREKVLFRRLSVFAGGCTLETASAVCNASQDLGLDVLDGVGSLLDKSLLRAREGRGGEPRVDMLQTIREYARERLEESGEGATVERAHAAYFLTLAERAEPHLIAADRDAWLEQLEAEHDNLRAALDRGAVDASAAETGARLAGALAWFWYLRGYLSEGRPQLEEALARADPSARTATRARVLLGAGLLAWAQGDPLAAETQVEESAAIYRALEDSEMVGRALLTLGATAITRGDPAMARARYEEASRIAQEARNEPAKAFALRGLGDAHYAAGDLVAARAAFAESLATLRVSGDAWGIAITLASLAMVALTQGDAAEARSLNEESVPLLRQTGNAWGLALVLINLGMATLRQGDQQRAGELFGESLGLWREMGNDTGDVMSLAGLAGVAAAAGQAERAGRLFGAAAAHFPAGFLPDGSDRSAFDQRVVAAKARLDAAAFAAGWAAGQAMTLEQASADALDGTDS